MAREFDDKHIPLAVAAALGCHQLSAPERPRFYDAEHLSDVITLVAQALIRVTRVYTRVEELNGRPAARRTTRGTS